MIVQIIEMSFYFIFYIAEEIQVDKKIKIEIPFSTGLTTISTGLYEWPLVLFLINELFQKHASF